MSCPGVEHGVSPEVEELRRQVAELRRELAAEVLKSSESRLALIFHGVSDLLFLIGVEAGPRFRCLTVNRAYLKGTGRTREQMEGKLVEEILPPEQARCVIEKYTAAVQRDRPSCYIEHADVPAGRLVVETTLTPIFNEQGNCTHLLGASHDITERERMVEALRESEERYRKLFENANDALATFTLDGTITTVNRAAERLLGWSREELLGQHVSKFATPASVALAAERAQRFLAGERLASSTFETELVHKDGRLVMVEARTRAIRDAAGKPVGFQGIYRDVTERKRMEAALHKSEQRYRAVVETQTELVCRFLPDTTLTFVNEAYCRYFGKSREELLGTSFLALIPEHARPAAKAHVDSLIAHPRLVVDEHEVLAAGGSIRWQRWTDQAIVDETGRLTEFQSTGLDITERKQAEEQLTESEARLRLLTELIPQHIWTALPDGSVDYVNKRWLDYSGLSLEEARSDGWTRVLSPDEREPVRSAWKEAVARGTMFELEEQHRGVDGKYRWFLVRALPLYDKEGRLMKWYGTKTDIEDRKRAEEALRQLQAELIHVSRVTTVGAMAASIAHEVNQPLGAIVGNADICLRWLARATPDLVEVRDALCDIIADGHRASEVITRIRSFVRKESTQQMSLDLNEVVREAIALANHEVREKRVVLRTELAADLPPVCGDRIQLEQVLLNLIMNGIEAMSEITERTRELVIRSGSDAEDKVLITVQDCGTGIAPQQAKRIFTAFYTTKPGGMGMGLAICRAIIEAHEGRLWVVPNAGPGATFQFTLPSDRAAK